jgi:hypothetical protein
VANDGAPIDKPVAVTKTALTSRALLLAWAGTRTVFVVTDDATNTLEADFLGEDGMLQRGATTTEAGVVSAVACDGTNAWVGWTAANPSLAGASAAFVARLDVASGSVDAPAQIGEPQLSTSAPSLAADTTGRRVVVYDALEPDPSFAVRAHVQVLDPGPTPPPGNDAGSSSSSSGGGGASSSGVVPGAAADDAGPGANPGVTSPGSADASSGCGCSLASRRRPLDAFAAVVMGLALLARRRRPSR